MHPIRRILISGLFSLFANLGWGATTYYIDYKDGSDTRSGTAPAEAWRHCPGDANATGKAASTTLQPGDTVIFKGGVAYRGSARIAASGETNAPIRIDGNTAGTFGSGRAVIEGADPCGGWKKCASAAEALGNPHWRNIWSTDEVPALDDVFTLSLSQGEHLMYLAQTPTPSELFWWDDLETAKSPPTLPLVTTPGDQVPGGADAPFLAQGDYTHEKAAPLRQLTLVDAELLTQSDPHAWDGAILAIFGVHYRFHFSPVTSYEPTRHELHVEPLKASFYQNPAEDKYILFNAMQGLCLPGQYIVHRAGAGARRRLFCWPANQETFERDVAVGARSEGFVLSGRHVVVQGFVIQHQAGGKVVAVGNAGEGTSHLVIRDNIIRWLRASLQAQRHATTSACIELQGSNDYIIQGNRIYDNFSCVGVLTRKCDRGLFQGNILARNSDTAVDIYGCTDVAVLQNKVLESKGHHANGLTFYEGNKNVLVEGNYVSCVLPLTLHTCAGLTIVNNFLDAGGVGNCISIWGGDSPAADNVTIEFNTLVRSENGRGIFDENLLGRNLVIRNNIIDGLTGSAFRRPCIVENNLFLSRGEALEKGSLGEAGLLETDVDRIFVDPLLGDYHLKSGSPAIGMGKRLPVKTDLEGRARPVDRAPDVGAYQGTGK